MFKPSIKFPVVGSRPEHELLLCCTRTYIDPENGERIKALLQEDIDWDYLITAARRNKILPLLYRGLHTTYPEAVPKPALDQLQEAFDAMSRRNLRLAEELLRLLHLLDTHGIPAIPYKGPILAVSAYGDLTHRQFWDMDILVRPQDVQKTKDLLVSQGYQSTLQMSWQITFVHNKCNVEVDLHWQLTQTQFTFPLDFDRLWKHLKPVSLVGTTVHTLSPDDSLLIRCRDAAEDYWQYHWPKLQWICDIAEFIRAYPDLDWGQVIRQADRLKTQGVLFLCLSLTRDLLGATLPEEVERKMQADPQLKSLPAIVGGRLFGEDERRMHDPQLGLLRKHFFSLRLKEHLPLPATISFPLLYAIGSLYYLVRSAWRNALIRVD